MLQALHIEPANLDQTYRSVAAILDAMKARDGKDGLVLSVADRVWVQKGLKLRPEYESLLARRFRAPIVQLDFLTMTTQPRWRPSTNGPRTRPTAAFRGSLKAVATGPMVLANAIYMLGEWQQPFAESATCRRQIHQRPGERPRS
jgi:serine protease inhibitor